MSALGMQIIRLHRAMHRGTVEIPMGMRVLEITAIVQNGGRGDLCRMTMAGGKHARR